jgi:hypothetical protein
MLLDRNVAGIIYVSGLHADTSADPDRYIALRNRGLPIVLVNGYAEGIDAPFISNDDVASMALALSHLANLGHTNIGLAVGPDRFIPSSAGWSASGTPCGGCSVRRMSRISSRERCSPSRGEESRPPGSSPRAPRRSSAART